MGVLRRLAIAAVVVAVTGVVFVESWQAAMAAAAAGGRPTPWLWPATLEGLILVLILTYWEGRASGARRWSLWAPRLACWAVTGLAALVQVLGAPRTVLGGVTAGITPFALMLSVEFAVARLYDGTAPTPAVRRRRVSRDASRVTAELAGAEPSPSASAVPPAPRAAGELRAEQAAALDEILAAEPRVSGARAVALLKERELGANNAKVYRYLAEHRNGASAPEEVATG